MIWTPAQLQAIGHRGENVLVSAAAGSGKTSVLTRRVVERALDEAAPVPIDRMLVVTFTVAAATEMRERIARELEQAASARPSDPWPRRQLALLGRAPIATLHSFCFRLIRQHFHVLDIDPGVRVMAEHEARLLQDEVLDEVIEERYAAGDAEFLDLLDHYGRTGDDALREAVLHVHRMAVAQADPAGWLGDVRQRYERAAVAKAAAGEGDPTWSAWMAPLAAFARREMLRAVPLLRRAARMAAEPGGPRPYAATLRADADRLLDAAGAVREDDWESLRDALARASAWPSLEAVREGECDAVLKERVKKLRDGAKGRVRRLLEYGLDRPSATFGEEANRLLPHVRALTSLTERFDAALQSAKTALAALDFADMERLTLRLLRDERVAQALRDEFDEVLVDEYQDINEAQDAILTSLSNGRNLFMVGDVKQSIYRFRQAEPALFLGKRDAVRRIDLNANFRSRAEVVDAVNVIFRRVFTPSLGGIAYGREDELLAAAGYPPLPEGDDPRVELHLVERGPRVPDRPEDEEADADGEGVAESPDDDTRDGVLHLEDRMNLEREAIVAGRRIQALILGAGGPPAEIWDVSLKSMRPARYGDVVVLLRRSRTQAAIVRNTLAEMGIPVHARASLGYFETIEVEWALALLELIDNPDQDIPLATVLRSPVVGLDAGELTRLGLAARGESFHAGVVRAAEGAVPAELATRLRSFLRALDGWRTAARRGPLARLIDRVYRETGLLDFVAAMPGGDQRRANLAALLDRARQFDGFAKQGLFRFLRFVDRLRERDEDLGTPPAEDAGDAVRIMTIHQSKGLEFPIVVVADLGGMFHRDAGDLLLDRTLGLGLKGVDLGLKVRYPSLPWLATRERMRAQDLAEEARILYVALTRARERLVLVGSANRLGERMERWREAASADGGPLPDETLLGAESFLDWIMPVALAPGEGPGWRWEVHRADEPAGHAGGAMAPGDAEADPDLWARIAAGQPVAPARTASPPAFPDLRARLDWSYPWRDLADLPGKRAASEWRWPLPDAEERGGWDAPAADAGPRDSASAAEIGSAVHLVLEHLDLTRTPGVDTVRNTLDKLTARGLLSADLARAVDPEPIARFFGTDLGRRVLAGPGAVRREWMFTLGVPASEAYPDVAAAQEDIVVVQGVVDLLAEGEDGVLLVDFKTDRPTAAGVRALAERYRGQIATYRRAVAEITGRPVREAYLYFLATGEAIRMDGEDGAG